VSHFQLFLTCNFLTTITVNFFFVTYIFYFYLDKKHPIASKCNGMHCQSSYGSLFFHLSVNVIVYAHVNVGVFTRTSFFLSLLAYSTILRMDGATVDAWLYFPGLKGRTKLISFLPY
jgi:hypothetical protein